MHNASFSVCRVTVVKGCKTQATQAYVAICFYFFQTVTRIIYYQTIPSVLFYSANQLSLVLTAFS